MENPSQARESGKGSFWDFGERMPGYEIRVFDERQVRAAAGILFLLGIVAYTATVFTSDFRPIQSFAMIFLIDMLLRLFVTPRISPLMLLGRLAVHRQKPEWVGAPQKRVAWATGLVLALVSCATLGIFALPAPVALTLCAICLTMLFLETAFGICVGCHLYSLFSRKEPQHCPGDSCNHG